MAKLFMSEKKIAVLLDKSRSHARNYAIFHVALATGLRAGDLLGLRCLDVAPRGEVLHTIRIKMQKTGKIVERGLPDVCRIALEKHLASRADDNPYLFTSESTNAQNPAGHMNRSSLHRLYKAYLGAMFSPEELHGNACHTTRRSVAKLISDKAGRIEPATRFLGHTSVANTTAYLDMDSYGRQADDLVGLMAWNHKPLT